MTMLQNLGGRVHPVLGREGGALIVRTQLEVEIHQETEPKALNGDQRPFGARRCWAKTKGELGEAGAEEMQWRVQVRGEAWAKGDRWAYPCI